MKKALLLLVSVLLVGSTADAQQHRTCSTHDRYEMAVTEDPSIATRRISMEQQLQQWITARGVQRNSSQVIVTIPVVVHVLWYNVNQNITDAQVLSQLDVLNRDYGRLNPDTNLVPAAFKPLIADIQFQFCMATSDPSGNPTTGIDRRQTSISRIGNGNRYYQTSQGGLDIWDPNSYLNFWICDIDGGSTLGYTYLPGTVNSNKDGVVIDWQCWGTIGSVAAPFNKGRTATHEVGHWFNLEHIWGDEPNCSMDDYVSDTPLQKGENYGCPSYPQTSQSGGRCSAADPSSMFMNYMDYTDDACMFMFTPGQAARMQASLNVSRPGLLTSLGCNNQSSVADLTPSTRASVHPNPSSGTFEFSINNQNSAGCQLIVTDVQGKLVLEKEFTSGDAHRFNLDDEPDGIYFIRLLTEGNTATARIVKQRP